MELENLFNETRIISAFLLILFSIFLLNQKKGNLKSYRFLAAFLLTRAGLLAGMVQWSYKIWLTVPHVAYLETPLLLLYAPFLYHYTKSVTQKINRRSPLELLHYLPFLSLLLFLLFKFHLHSASDKIMMIESGAVYASLPKGFITNILWGQFVVYVVLCGNLLLIFQKKIKSYYSNSDGLNYYWLRFLLVAFFVWKGIFLTGYLFHFFQSDVFYLGFCIFIEAGFLVYASLIVYKGLQMPELFNMSPTNNKYRTSPLKQADKIRYLQKIESYLKSQKLYLNPNLTLKELSSQVSIPVHYISQVLNDTRQQNFYDFINFYRIQETKKYLANPEHREKTVMEILYEAGFNSKSVFNNAFKRFEGITPMQYRKQILSKNIDTYPSFTNMHISSTN